MRRTSEMSTVTHTHELHCRICADIEQITLYIYTVNEDRRLYWIPESGQRRLNVEEGVELDYRQHDKK